MSPRSQRTINIGLLIGTLVAVFLLALSAYFVRRVQMPRISQQFLRLAENEEKKARESDDLGEKAKLLAQASNYIYRYLQLAPQQNVDEEIRMARLWNESADLLSPGRGYIAAKQRAVSLYAMTLGAVESSGVRQEEVGPLRLELLALLSENFRSIDQLEHAQHLFLHDMPREQREATGDISKKVMDRIQTLDDPAEQAALDKANPYVAQSLRHMAEGLWRLFRRAALPADQQKSVCAILRNSVRENPDSVMLAVNYAMLLREHPWLADEWVAERYPTSASRAELADAAVDEVVKRSPNAESLLARASYRSRFELPGVGEDVDAAMKADKDNLAVLLYAAEYFVRASRRESDEEAKETLLDDAVECYADVRRINPEVVVAHWRAVDVLIELKKIDEAMAIADEAAQRFPNSREVLSRIAQVSLLNNDLDEAEEWLAKLEKSTQQWQAPSEAHKHFDTEVELVRASFHLEGNQPKRALKHALPIAQAAEVSPERLSARRLVAKAYLAMTMWDQAAWAFEQAARDAPQDLALIGKAGEARMRAGHFDLASAHFEKLLRTGSSESLLILYAETLQNHQAFTPKEKRDWKKFDDAVSQLQKWKDPTVPWMPVVFEARKAAMEEDHGAVHRLLDAALEEHRSQADLVELAASIYLSIGDHERASGLAASLAHTAIAPKAGGDADVGSGGDDARDTQLLIQVNLLLDEKNYAGAIALMEEQLNQRQKAKRNRLVATIINVYLNAGKNQNAKASLSQFAALAPADLPAVTAVVDRLLTRGLLSAKEVADWEARIRAVEGSYGTLATFLNCRQRLRQIASDPQDRKRQLVQVRDSLERLRERPTWPGLYLVSADVAVLEGNDTEAIRHLETALQYGDRRLEVIQRLLSLYWKKNRVSDASELLDRVAQLQPQSSALSSLGIALAVKGDDFQLAESIAQRRLEFTGEDGPTHRQLGVIYSVKGEFDKAVTHLEKATELQPKDLESWNALLTHHVNRDQLKQAELVLDRMADALSTTKAQRLFLKAQGYERIRPELARTMYEQALVAKRTDDPQVAAITAGCGAYYVRIGDIQTAKELFNEAKRLAAAVGDESVIRASHRALAAIEGQIGGEGWLKRAKQHLEIAGNYAGGGEGDERANSQIAAVLLMARGEVEEGGVAQRNLEELARAGAKSRGQWLSALPTLHVASREFRRRH